MGDNSAIEWTDASWNPIRGCSRVSEGCRNCYAERTAIRQANPLAKLGHVTNAAYAGLVKSTPAGPRWTGEVRFVEEALTLPLRWTKPRRIFVNSMSDLFHEKVERSWIDRIFSVMACAQQHTFQVLTKRPARMLAWFEDIADAGLGPDGKAKERGAKFFRYREYPWPLPNVHLGVSVEDQATADARIPLLLQTPAAMRWVSYEPALGPVSFTDHDWTVKDYLRGTETCQRSVRSLSGKVDWLVAGGESGPGARPPHPDWFRSARDQCVAAGVPYFFKQWGEWAEVPRRTEGPGRMVRGHDVVVTKDGRRAAIDPRTLGCDLEGQGIPMRRVGKKAAGRLLDGREWNEFPR